MEVTLASVLINRRKHIGKTIEEVAADGRAAGAFIRAADLKRYEDGKVKTIQIAMLRKLSSAYDLKPEVLEPYIVRRGQKALEVT